MAEFHPHRFQALNFQALSPQRLRMVLRLVSGMLLLVLGVSLAICWRIHSSNASADRDSFVAEPMPQAGERILVFSPHCDDETLGAGGFIDRAIRRGAIVRVVMITNGDGFGLAAALHYRRIVTPGLLRRFAAARQLETIQADAELGVPSTHIYFLGFPDQGLASLWGSNWSPAHPYFSRQTSCSRNPYTSTVHPNQLYCGVNVLSDIEEQILDFRPNRVLMPHPNDDHPDHWATSAFVRAALADLARKPALHLGPVAAQTFIVHHGDWPVPQGYHPAVRLPPPASLTETDTVWRQFPLDKEAERAKLNAIHQYRSQMAVMARFLESFVRSTECLGTVPSATLPSDAAGGEALIERNPISDTVLRTVEAGANIEEIRASRADANVSLRVQFHGPVSSRITYSVGLHEISPNSISSRQWRVTVHGRHVECNIPGGRAILSGHSVLVLIPEKSFDRQSLWFTSARTQLGYMALDRAGWRELHLYPARDTGQSI